MEEGLCVNSDVDFFSEDPQEIEKAKSICFECPVRRQCLEYALENDTRFGTWGGADEVTLRKAQSIDQYGKPLAKEKPIRCPYCDSKNVDATKVMRTTRHMLCADCSLEWWARVPPTLVKINKEDLDDNDEE